MKTMLDGNIFREAKQLLRDDPMMMNLAGEELITAKAALLPLNLLPEFDNKTIDWGLKKLAQMFEEAKGRGK